MSLDGIVTRALVRELQPCVGAKISKIYQPTEHEIVIHMRGHNANKRLLLSAHPSMPRLHYTHSVWENPAEPPMFCMLLRKYCEGGTIERIAQVDLERVVHFDIRHRDELGDLALKRIVLEMMGRHSNLILLDPESGLIHDGIRRVTPAVSSYRSVLPGATYKPPPPQGKRHPLTATEQQFRQAIASIADMAADNWDPVLAARALVAAFTGISPLTAAEIAHRAGGEQARLWPVFHEAMQQAAHHRYEPCQVESDDGKTFFSALKLTHLSGRPILFDSMHACLESYYQDKADRDFVRQRTADLSKLLSNEIAKNVKKLSKLEETLQETVDADRWRKYGELLNAHLHQLNRGDTTANLIDYYDENQPTISIPLEPTLTPAENAQRYFRKYSKLKNSRSIVEEQIQATREEIVYLESVLHSVATADPSDIEDIREELTEQGYIRDRSRKRGPKRKKKETPDVLKFMSSEGIPIYVGKNNAQNDYLTSKLGRPTDTWLHTKDIPGSHVLIRSKQYGESTLKEAAMLAAYYSKAKQSGNVPVDYTLIRNVRKPNGAKPGFVIYEGQRTLFVTPDEAIIQSLAAQAAD